MRRLKPVLFWLLIILVSGCGVERKADEPTSVPTQIALAASPTPTATQVIEPSRTPVTPVTAVPLIGSTFTPIPVTATLSPSATPSSVPTTAPQTSSINGQVSAGSDGLRLRESPTSSGRVLDLLDELVPLTILGRTSDSVWLRVITADNQNGWVMSQYVTVNSGLASLPVMDNNGNTASSSAAFAPVASTPVPVDLASAQAYVVAEGQGVRLRALPSVNSEVLGTLPEQTTLQIIGRVQDNSWLQVQLANGSEGWVFAQYVKLNIGLDAVAIPEVAFQPTPTAAGGNYASVSGVTSNSVQIFLRGQSLGNRPNVFAKVGDSITATWPYLYPIGWGDYSLRSYSHLQGAINYFIRTRAIDANSFASHSASAHGGWATTTVLDPSMAEAHLCNPGEMPLVCEYRLVKPSVALIMLGSNDQWTDPAIFEANLHQIVQISIDMGVIPAISTIPPTNLNWADKVPVMNQIITNTARQYDVPLWDFYSAMLPLPNQGLSSDGVHPSVPPAGDRAAADFSAENLQYGFTVRNLMALQMLDAIWRQVIAPNEGITPPPAPAQAEVPLQPGEVVANPQPASGACAGFTPRLAVGMTGRVTPGSSNNLRSEPSTSAAKIGSIPPGATFAVLAGPACSSGLTYWQVNYNGTIGWTPEGQGSSEYWVEPA